MDSLKAQTNKKWTSSEKYRDNWEKIFKKKEDDVSDESPNKSETNKKKENKNER